MLGGKFQFVSKHGSIIPFSEKNILHGNIIENFCTTRITLYREKTDTNIFSSVTDEKIDNNLCIGRKAYFYFIFIFRFRYYFCLKLVEFSNVTKIYCDYKRVCAHIIRFQ